MLLFSGLLVHLAPIRRIQEEHRVRVVWANLDPVLNGTLALSLRPSNMAFTYNWTNG